MRTLVLKNGRYQGLLNDGRLLCVLPDVFEMNKGHFSEQELHDPQEWLSSVDGENCWIEQPKRLPGRPRKGKGRHHVDLTLSIEVIEALEHLTVNKSKFVDEWLRQHPQIAEQLETSPS